MSVVDAHTEWPISSLFEFSQNQEPIRHFDSSGDCSTTWSPDLEYEIKYEMQDKKTRIVIDRKEVRPNSRIG